MAGAQELWANRGDCPTRRNLVESVRVQIGSRIRFRIPLLHLQPSEGDEEQKRDQRQPREPERRRSAC